MFSIRDRLRSPPVGKLKEPLHLSGSHFVISNQPVQPILCDIAHATSLTLTIAGHTFIEE